MDVRTLAPTEYPTALREIPGMPDKLFIRGAMPSKNTKLLAVVGSRALSHYGKEACEMLIAGLAGYPVSIVSGLALGADACAHRAALSAGLHTIAIPGSGLDDSVIGPRTNLGLAKEILNAGGALISEHEPLHRAYPSDFPSRNRIMAGMSDAVLVIEASERSGTLITARLAGEYSRDLLVVPHRIGDAHGTGCHIFARIGAAIVTESNHILESLGLDVKERGNSNTHLDLVGVEKDIWELLREPRDKDSILRSTPSATGDVLTALVSLELRGLIREEFGAWQRVA